MTARRTLLAAALGLAGCGLAQRPYPERREWPLTVRRPVALPPRPGGPVLMVRGVSAAPGLGARGLQWLETDGSLHVDYYEEWIVPPAEAVESDLARWLADSGLFAAVIVPGSRLPADLVLEATLGALLAEPARGLARCALAIALIDQRPRPVRVLAQRDLSAEQPLAGRDAPAMVAALRSALGSVLAQAEQALAPFASPRQGTPRG